MIKNMDFPCRAFQHDGGGGRDDAQLQVYVTRKHVNTPKGTLLEHVRMIGKRFYTSGRNSFRCFVIQMESKLRLVLDAKSVILVLSVQAPMTLFTLVFQARATRLVASYLILSPKCVNFMPNLQAGRQREATLQSPCRRRILCRSACMSACMSCRGYGKRERKT